MFAFSSQSFAPRSVCLYSGIAFSSFFPPNFAERIFEDIFF